MKAAGCGGARRRRRHHAAGAFRLGLSSSLLLDISAAGSPAAAETKIPNARKVQSSAGGRCCHPLGGEGCSAKGREEADSGQRDDGALRASSRMGGTVWLWDRML